MLLIYVTFLLLFLFYLFMLLIYVTFLLLLLGLSDFQLGLLLLESLLRRLGLFLSFFLSGFIASPTAIIRVSLLEFVLFVTTVSQKIWYLSKVFHGCLVTFDCKELMLSSLIRRVVKRLTVWCRSMGLTYT